MKANADISHLAYHSILYKTEITVSKRMANATGQRRYEQRLGDW